MQIKTSMQKIYAHKYSENDLEELMVKWRPLGRWESSSQRELWSVMPYSLKKKKNVFLYSFCK